MMRRNYAQFTHHSVDELQVGFLSLSLSIVDQLGAALAEARAEVTAENRRFFNTRDERVFVAAMKAANLAQAKQLVISIGNIPVGPDWMARTKGCLLSAANALSAIPHAPAVREIEDLIELIDEVFKRQEAAAKSVAQTTAAPMGRYEEADLD